MRRGPTLAISGTLFGGVLLSILLFTISTGAAVPNRPQSPDEGQDIEGVQENSRDLDLKGEEKLTHLQPACQLSESFPASILQWCHLITQYAVKRGLDAELVAALIWQESGGDPLAYSRSGAVGLMQIMPRDGLAAGFICANGPCFSNRPTSEQLQDPEFNIAYGTRMLAGLLRRNGSLREALRAYGPMDAGYSYADKVMGIFQRFERKSY